MSAAKGPRDGGARLRLEIVPVGGVSRTLLGELARALEARLGIDCAVGDEMALRPEWRDAQVRGYRSGPIVDALLAERDAAEGAAGEAWALAVVDARLGAPEVGEVFGEAAVGGGCAVVGLGALAPEPRDEAVLLQRLVKTAVHETGHMAGGGHCPEPQCVMYPSADIADTDRKGERLCERCLRALFPVLSEANA